LALQRQGRAVGQPAVVVGCGRAVMVDVSVVALRSLDATQEHVVHPLLSAVVMLTAPDLHRHGLTVGHRAWVAATVVVRVSTVARVSMGAVVPERTDAAWQVHEAHPLSSRPHTITASGLQRHWAFGQEFVAVRRSTMLAWHLERHSRGIEWSTQCWRQNGLPMTTAKQAATNQIEKLFFTHF